jgi:hypothetical protein
MTGLEIGWQLYLLLFCLVVILPVLAVWLFCLWRQLALRPALWSMVGATMVYMVLSWGISSNSVTLEENRLALQAGFYHAQIDNIGLASSAIHVLPQDKLGEYAPVMAVNGIRLPGYQVGWYLLQNRKLAFVMIIGQQREVSLIRSGDMTAVVGGNLFSSTGRMMAVQ